MDKWTCPDCIIKDEIIAEKDKLIALQNAQIALTEENTKKLQQTLDILKQILQPTEIKK